MSDIPRRIAHVQRRFPLIQIVALAALFAYGAGTINGFSGGQSIRTMLVLAAITGLAAAGQTLVMIIGGLDLSIPGFISAGALVVTQLTGGDGWSLLPAVVAVALAAAALGALSGWICQRWLIQPIIVTLGMGSVALGAALIFVRGQVTAEAPQVLSDLTAANGTTFGVAVPTVIVIWAVLAVVIAVFLRRTAAGRRLYAAGANPRAAALAQVPLGRVWTATFAASAVLSALVGVLLAGFAGADQSVGDPYFFGSLTAVIVGGTTIAGSRGDYTHTVVGALILTELTTVLVGRGYDAPVQQMIFGALILIVVATYGRERRLRDRL